MHLKRLLRVLPFAVAFHACDAGDRKFTDDDGDGGSAGDSAGSGGEGGDAGGGGDAGEGGSAGEGGYGGEGGSAGDGGAGGEGGSAGSGGASGDGGSAGSGGSGGGGECSENADCSDGNDCNGRETCDTGECLRGENADDGTACTVSGETGNHFCKDGNCQASRCGDQVVDPDADEQCDDGNSDDGDGCDNDCTYSCEDPSECDDGELCTGEETCSSHQCRAGNAEPDGTPCGSELECRQGGCVRIGCGNGFVEPEKGEECDDGNVEDGDGCDNDCKYSCKENVDCDDADVCNGLETCNTSAHVCRPGTPLECTDESACTENACDPTNGCHFPLIDNDYDGHASEDLGTCGDDCDDDDYKVWEGAPELCDGKDNDCDEQIDESAPTWWVDCDGDAYAAANALSEKNCVEPPRWSGCPDASAGRWTTTKPETGTTDCWDNDPDVHPNDATNPVAWQVDPIPGRAASVDYDYDCDNLETQRYTASAGTCTISQPFLFCSGSGWVDGTAATCGAWEYYRTCSRSGKFCTTNEALRRQECK